MNIYEIFVCDENKAYDHRVRMTPVDVTVFREAKAWKLPSNPMFFAAKCVVVEVTGKAKD